MVLKLVLVGAFFLLAAVATLGDAQMTEKCQHGLYKDLERISSIPKTFQVNLDEEAKTRWNVVVVPKKKEIAAAIKQVVNLISDLSPKIVGLVDKYLPRIVNKLPAPYGDEIEGIASATGVEHGEILLFNIFYEIFTACTSIVATDDGGVVYHARNLDFGLFMGWDNRNHTWLLTEYLRPLVVNVDFMRNNEIVYKSVHFAGYVGVLTGVKPQAFTLTLNERFNINGGFIGVIEWILGDHSGQWTTFLTRDVLEKANTYDEAVFMLQNQEILAPVYYIVGGRKPFEGAIITRDRTSLTNYLEMNSTEAGGWYVLQTNYDNWKSPPFFDNRRDPGNKCMAEVGQKNVGIPTLYDVLSTKPVMNLLTTYTTLMQVDKGSMETYNRVCPQPCFPW